MNFKVLTLFPDLFEPFVQTSIVKKGIDDGQASVCVENIRAYSTDKHNSVDDMPYGGGAGMVMTPQPLDDALSSVCTEKSHVIFLSPKGQRLTQNKVNTLAQKEELVLLCGHYEGIDQRIIDTHVDEELSIGDYVLTGGELPAMVVMDAVIRLLPGVIGSADSYKNDSHYNGLLDHPHYTRPQVYKGQSVPKVLLSGHHKRIEEWRKEQALMQTLEKRPDLLEKYLLEGADEALKEKIQKLLKKDLR